MFRDYTNVNINVKNNYKNARQFQTLNFVKYMNNKYNKFINSISINNALNVLNNFIVLYSCVMLDLPMFIFIVFVVLGSAGRAEPFKSTDRSPPIGQTPN